MRKLRVLNAKPQKKADSLNVDALDEKKIREAYKAALQLKDGAFSAIEKAYSMIKAIKKGADTLEDADWNVEFADVLEKLSTARNALKGIG